MRVTSLIHLNEQARLRTEDLPLSVGVPDRETLWAPMELAPLSHLSSFHQLSDLQKIRYNQLFALGIVEQFIWFEEGLLCPILERLNQTTELSSDLKQAIEIFILEERSHSKMFHQLLDLAEPKLYSEGFHLLKLQPWQSWILKIFKSAPKIFVAWSWLAVFFEERTLAFSRAYARNQDKLDRSFVAVHLRHMQDEASHVQMDAHFIENFFEPAPFWQRWIASYFVTLMLRVFASPHRVSRRILLQMRLEFADFSEAVHGSLLKELKEIGGVSRYQEIAFGEPATRRTRQLLAQHECMQKCLRFLLNRDQSLARIPSEFR